jgi:WD40 repeat protein
LNRNSILFDASNRTELFSLHGDRIIGFTPDAQRLICWGADGLSLRFVTTPHTNSEPARLEKAGPDCGPFVTEGFSPGFEVFVAIDRSGLVRFWKNTTGKFLGSIHGPAPPIRAAALAPGGSRVALAVERENIIHLYDRETQRELTLTGHHDFVSGLAFSPDGRTLASGSMDGTIGLWDTKSGAQLSVLRGHLAEVTDVAFAPDGKTLASISRKESIKFWHLPTRRELFTINFPEAGGALSFSADGEHLAANTQLNTVRLLDAPRGESLGRTDR